MLTAMEKVLLFNTAFSHCVNISIITNCTFGTALYLLCNIFTDLFYCINWLLIELVYIILLVYLDCVRNIVYSCFGKAFCHRALTSYYSYYFICHVRTDNSKLTSRMASQKETERLEVRFTNNDYVYMRVVCICLYVCVTCITYMVYYFLYTFDVFKCTCVSNCVVIGVVCQKEQLQCLQQKHRQIGRQIKKIKVQLHEAQVREKQKTHQTPNSLQWSCTECTLLNDNCFQRCKICCARKGEPHSHQAKQQAEQQQSQAQRHARGKKKQQRQHEQTESQILHQTPQHVDKQEHMQQHSSDWKCSQCTTMNPQSCTQCKTCKLLRVAKTSLLNSPKSPNQQSKQSKLHVFFKQKHSNIHQETKVVRKLDQIYKEDTDSDDNVIKEGEDITTSPICDDDTSDNLC